MTGPIRLFAPIGLLAILVLPAAAQDRGKPLQLPPPTIERGSDDLSALVPFLFAEVKRLAAENEELRRRLAAPANPFLPVSGYTIPGCLGQHHWTSDEILHPYPESVRLRALR
jgi:hypothetical protein